MDRKRLWVKPLLTSGIFLPGRLKSLLKPWRLKLMNFYHNLVTEKSWHLLLTLRKRYRFILIGGWAVFLYTQALKSKDIDLVVEYGELEKLREAFGVSKKDRLPK